jgi:hypothetical protein
LKLFFGQGVLNWRINPLSGKSGNREATLQEVKRYFAALNSSHSASSPDEVEEDQVCQEMGLDRIGFGYVSLEKR